MLSDGKRHLHSEERGSGEPLILIPGFGLPCATLRPLLSAGPSDQRWITYDHPGIGGSDPRPHTCTTGRLAAATIDLLDAFELENAHIAGLSLGGAVAIELALQAPRRVSSLILMSTTAGGPLNRHLDLVGLTQTAAQIFVGSARRGRPWFAPALYSRAVGDREDAALDDRGAPDATTPRPARISPPASVLLGQMCAASLHARSGQLDRLRMPTLVIHGERDVLLPVANARAMTSAIPQAQLTVIPGAGHGFPLERPCAVGRLLGDWVAGTAVSPP